jgi:hypothetical protein
VIVIYLVTYTCCIFNNAGTGLHCKTCGIIGMVGGFGLGNA